MIVSYDSKPIPSGLKILRGNAATLRYVEFLTGDENTPIYWRSILEPGGGEAEKHGLAPLATALPNLNDAQKRQHGIFAVVNAGGQNAAEIDLPRASYIDMDGEKTAGRRWQDMRWHVQPHFLVVRDDTHFHAYWLVDDSFPIGRFTSTQKRLISHYGSDPVICDLARVMRVPGFRHLKDPDCPKDAILVDLVPGASDLWGAITALRLSLADLTAGLPQLIDSGTGKPALKAREDLEMDLEINIKAARRHLKTYRPANAISEGGENPGGVDGDTYTVITANCLMDFGVSPETAFELLTTSVDGEPSWNERCDPPWRDDELWAKVQSAAASRQNDIGCRAVDDPSKRFAKWVEVSSADPDQTTFFDPFVRQPPPDFPLDALSGELRAYAEAIGRSTGTDASPAAMLMLGAISGALDQRFTLKLTGEWTVRPRLWIMDVDDPSAGKGRLFDAVTGPIEKVQAERWAEYFKRHHAWEADKANGHRYNEPDEPSTLLLKDATPERIVQMLERRPRGLLLRVDEFSGFIGGMDRYRQRAGAKGGSYDRSFWAECYDGKARASGRVTTGGRYAEHMSIAFVAAVQPDRLRELGDLGSDGFLQRFIPISIGRTGSFVEDVSSADVETLLAYKRLIACLCRSEPAPLQLMPLARKRLTDVRRQLHRIETDMAYGSSFRQFVGKLGGIVGSLAIVLHVARRPDALTDSVDLDTANAVERVMMEYIVPSGLDFYRWSIEKTLTDTQLSIARFVLCDDRAAYTPSAFTNNVGPLHHLSAKSRQVHEHLEFLVNWGWLGDERKPGHPFPVAYHVHPRLRTALSAIRDREEQIRRARQMTLQKEIIPKLRERKNRSLTLQG